TIIFEADVNAQGGAYATGVLVLISSAAVAVTLSARRRGARPAASAFGLISLVFLYTTAVNVVERPDRVKIAAFFMGALVFPSLISRVWRPPERRVAGVPLAAAARQLIAETGDGPLRIIANQPDERDVTEYRLKEQEQRAANHIPPGDPVMFLE